MGCVEGEASFLFFDMKAQLIFTSHCAKKISCGNLNFYNVDTERFFFLGKFASATTNGLDPLALCPQNPKKGSGLSCKIKYSYSEPSDHCFLEQRSWDDGPRPFACSAQLKPRETKTLERKNPFPLR